MDNKKRVSLYFNLDDPDEKLMFEYLDVRKKSQYIKNLILNDIKGHGIVSPPVIKTRIDTLDDCDLDIDGIDLDD